MAVVNLLDKHRERIVDIQIPPFEHLPDVIVWDTRVFKLFNTIGQDLVHPDYVETTAWFFLAPGKPREMA